MINYSENHILSMSESIVQEGIRNYLQFYYCSRTVTISFQVMTILVDVWRDRATEINWFGRSSKLSTNESKLENFEIHFWLVVGKRLFIWVNLTYTVYDCIIRFEFNLKIYCTSCVWFCSRSRTFLHPTCFRLWPGYCLYLLVTL